MTGLRVRYSAVLLDSGYRRQKEIRGWVDSTSTFCNSAAIGCYGGSAAAGYPGSPQREGRARMRHWHRTQASGISVVAHTDDAASGWALSFGVAKCRPLVGWMVMESCDVVAYGGWSLDGWNAPGSLVREVCRVCAYSLPFLERRDESQGSSLSYCPGKDAL